MNKKLVKATTAAALVSTVVSPCATVMAQGIDTVNGTQAEAQSNTQTMAPKSVEEAKKELEKATERNKKALAAQQAALDELNLAKEEKEKAAQKVLDAIAKAEAAKVVAEEMLAQKQTESKDNLAHLNTQYADAMKAQEEAEAYLAEQQKILEAQVAIQEAANKKLEEAQANITVTEQDVAKKQSDLEKAKTQFDTATANAETAKQKVEALKNDITSTEAARTQAQKELDDANAAKAQAEAQIPGLQQAYDTAKTAYEEAFRAYTDGTPELESAKQQVNAAQQALDAANADLSVKQQGIAVAEQALAEAQNLIVDAENGVTEADKQLAIANAASVLANAQAEYETALQVQTQAMNAVTAETNVLNEITARYQEKQDQLVALESTKTQAEQALSKANVDVIIWTGKVEETKDVLIMNQKELERLKGEQVAAQTEYDAAQAELGKATATKTNAETAVKDAEIKLEQAKQDAMTAKEKIKEGSLGFFKELGCQKAIDRIKEYSSGKYAQYWMFGDERDASSLENMKKSLEYIKYCQQMLREEQEKGEIDTTGDFKVSLDQIAAAQVGANISSVTHKHSGVVGDENLIWGMSMTPKDAYDSWYTEEKENYKNGMTGTLEVGHYENLRNHAQSAGVTGIAIHDSVWNEDGTFKHSPTISQTFNYTTVTGDGEENFVFSVDRYEKLFMDYYNKLHAQLNGEEAAQRALDEAKAALDQAVAGVSTATQVSNEAKNKLDAATSKVEVQQGSVTTIEGNLNTLKQELEEKNQTFAEAQAKVEKTTQDIETAQREAAELQNRVQEQSEKLQQAKDKAAEADKTLADKKNIRDEAKKSYEALTGQTNGKLPSTEEADQMLKDANAGKTQALEALQNAKDNETAKREALARANEDATKAIEEVAKKEQILKDTEETHAQVLAKIYEKLQNEKGAMDTAKTALDEAKAVLDDKKQQVADAENKVDVKDKELFALREKLEAAQADYDFKLAAHNISKIVYEESQKNYNEVVKAITPLREAKAEYDKAVADRKVQEGKVEAANKDIVEKEALVTASQKAAEAAKKDHDVLSGVTVEGLMETPMTEDAYLYLNAYVDGYKKSLDEKAQADKDSTVSLDRVAASEVKYAEAKKYATQTTADLLIAQDNYDKAVEAEKEQNENNGSGDNGSGNGGTGEQGGNQDGNNEDSQDNNGSDSENQNGSGNAGSNGQSGTGNDQNGTNQEGTNQNDKNQNKPAATTPEKGNKAPKTADLSGIGMASFGLFSSATLAAMTTMFKRKRRNDEE